MTSGVNSCFQKNNDAKDKKRQEKIQEKYKDQTVVIQVVHVVVEWDESGNEKDERYAMTKWMANGGKEKTATCYSEYFISACLSSGATHYTHWLTHHLLQ